MLQIQNPPNQGNVHFNNEQTNADMYDEELEGQRNVFDNSNVIKNKIIFCKSYKESFVIMLWF